MGYIPGTGDDAGTQVRGNPSVFKDPPVKALVEASERKGILVHAVKSSLGAVTDREQQSNAGQAGGRAGGPKARARAAGPIFVGL